MLRVPAWRNIGRVALAAPALLVATPLAAQCRDGSPPPCDLARSTTVPLAPLKLDDKTWLVLPFENSGKVADAELISPASLTLLNQELGRWQDVRRVPEDRVAELIAAAPGRSTGAMGLQAALAIARRMGAGRLVLGSYLAIGGRADVTARIYDVKSGTELRRVPESIRGYASPTALDSITATFRRVTLKALDVPPTTRSSTTLGTSNLEAYRAFAAGMAAFRRLRSDTAALEFERATAIDSGFAVAHAMAGQAYQRLLRFSKASAAFDVARRHADRLPWRESVLLAVWQNANDLSFQDETCRAARALLERDSTDVEGWRHVAACSPSTLPPDPRRPRYLTNPNETYRALTHALSLDPTNSTLLQQVVGGLFGGLMLANGNVPRLHLAGDSLEILLARHTDSPYGTTFGATDSATRAFIVRRALAVAEPFVQVNPLDAVGHLLLGRAYLAAARFVEADDHFRRAASLSTLIELRRQLFEGRILAAMGAERPADARALVDSMLTDPGSSWKPELATAFGVFRADSTQTQAVTVRATHLRLTPIFAGILADSDRAILETFGAVEGNAMPVSQANKDAYVERATDVWRRIGFFVTRGRPAADTASPVGSARVQAFIAVGDTAHARIELQKWTEDIRARPLHDYSGDELFAAEALVLLRDSTSALSLLQRFASQWPLLMSAPNVGLGSVNLRRAQPFVRPQSLRLVTRTWLLYGDVAYGLGAKADAIRAYRMVVGMWERGEPPVQPLVERARARLKELGG
jgi:tetratricopeptide (TPR) repeat protein